MGSDDLEGRVAKLEQALSAFARELRLALDYIRPDAASSLTKSRVVLEKILVGVYTVEMGHAPRKPLLGDMLADNQFTRKVERRVLSRMNSVRDMANLGPHGEPVEPSDAARVLDDLCEVLDWYLRRYPGGGPGASDGPPRDERRPDPAAVQAEEDRKFLERLGRELLTANSTWELRRQLYELEAFLSRNPHSVDARLLKDRVQTAITRAAEWEQVEEMVACFDEDPREGARGCARGCWIFAVLMLLAGLLAFAYGFWQAHR
jgi:hypothetical protein